jgi:riboflavin synthase
MFTGIVECTGEVESVRASESNLIVAIRSSLGPELKIDQSVSHNGVCLTVTSVNGNVHEVTAVAETLQRSNLGDWKAGSIVNLERCLRADGRLDGHIVQGHVDATGTISSVNDRNGSWELQIAHEPQAGITVPKGSVAVNGVSLTVVDSCADGFSVVIIPYTWEFTNLSSLQPGSVVNLEFDILGKYMQKLLQRD